MIENYYESEGERSRYGRECECEWWARQRQKKRTINSNKIRQTKSDDNAKIKRRKKNWKEADLDLEHGQTSDLYVWLFGKPAKLNVNRKWHNTSDRNLI